MSDPSKWFNNINVETLWHYTSVPILYEFIKEDAWLYATQYENLNDEAELRYGREVFNQAVNNISFLSNYKEWEKNAQRMPIYQIMERNIFISSFSGKSDMVSMWSAYTSPEGGYAIGFNVEKLKQALRTEIANFSTEEMIKVGPFSKVPSKKRLNFYKCQYDKDESISYCEEILKGHFSKHSPDDEELVMLQLLYWREQIITEFKHKSFQDEDEYRLAYFGPRLQDEIQMIGNKPRVKLFESRNVIDKVIVSPHGNISKNYANALLLREKFNLDYKVIKSDSTYRG